MPEETFGGSDHICKIPIPYMIKGVNIYLKKEKRKCPKSTTKGRFLVSPLPDTLESRQSK